MFLDIGDLTYAREAVWSRIAFVTRYSSTTFTEAMCELDVSDMAEYMAALGKLIQQENAKRD